MKNTIIKFPDTTMPLDMVVDIQMPRPLGLTARVFIQEKARTLPFYNQSIECEAEGKSIDGKKIAINTVGRWLFGVPGYTGHIRIVPSNDKIKIYYPKQSPKAVHELIYSLTI